MSVCEERSEFLFIFNMTPRSRITEEKVKSEKAEAMAAEYIYIQCAGHSAWNAE